jgi:hypothetical protein
MFFHPLSRQQSFGLDSENFMVDRIDHLSKDERRANGEHQMYLA